MFDRIAVLIPTYGRNDRLAQVVENCRAATPMANVYLLMEPDQAIEVADATTLTRPEGFGNYAAAINHGYRNTTEPLLFAGADDLNFWDGWSAHCQALIDQGYSVVGTNDLGNPEVLAGQHATHYLVKRTYLDTVGGVFDEGPCSFMPEVYDHNWTDREFIRTAEFRGVWTPCLDAIVEHQHPAWGKASMDDTYVKSYAKSDDDQVIYNERMNRMLGAAA